MKPLTIIGAIIAVLALIGDLVFMFLLITMGEAASALQEAGGTDVQEISSVFSMVIAGGWLWAILVLLTCLFFLKMALNEMASNRKKK